MSDQILLTSEALKKLKKELDILKNVRRKEIAEKIFEAKEKGDLSENAEYHDAKDEQGFLEANISQLDYKIKSAIISDEKNSDKVCLGCEVTVSDESGKESVFTVVSFNEADPKVGRISSSSPLGNSLIDGKKGDEVDVEFS